MRNLLTKTVYSDKNTNRLSKAAKERGYKSDGWLTFSQMKKLQFSGVKIKLNKGSKAVYVDFPVAPNKCNKHKDKACDCRFSRVSLFNLDCFTYDADKLKEVIA